MMDVLLAAWWGPLIPIGMVLLAILYSALHAARRRSPRTETHAPPSPSEPWRPLWPERVPPPVGPPPFPRPQIPGWPARERPAQPSAESTPNRPPSVPTPTAPPQRPGPVREPWKSLTLPAPPPVAPAPAWTSRNEPAERVPGESPSASVRALEAAAGIVDRAASLQARVQQQLQLADFRVQHAAPSPVPGRVSRRQPVPASWIRKLRSPASAREAWIASIIFAPPRSMQ